MGVKCLKNNTVRVQAKRDDYTIIHETPQVANLPRNFYPNKMPSPKPPSPKKPKPAWLVKKLIEQGYTFRHQPELPQKPTGPLPDETELTGQVLRSLFTNPENGYGVVILKRADGGEDACLAGNLAGVMPGVEVQVTGHWVDHPKHGRQFQVETSTYLLPRNISGLERYLASGILPGVNEATAEAIVKQFGKDTLNVLDNHPERLKEVPGIGAKRYQGIVDAWKKASGSREELIFLEGLGISPLLAQKIITKYEGQSAAQLVRQNPYRLARDVEGVGFLTSDRIASSLGIAQNAPIRIASGLAYALDQASLDGHVFLPKCQLFDKSAKLLNVPLEVMEMGYQEALACRSIVAYLFPDCPEPLCYLPEMAWHERTLARLVHIHLQNQFPAYDRLKKLPQRPGEILLNEEQRLAVETALVSPISIITGGPGVGKTTVLRRVVDMADANHWKVLLAAPTGRAAKRLSEAVHSREASTIHRLLKYDPNTHGFEYGQDKKLECDLLVVDEVSMLDQSLAQSLLSAVSPDTRLVLVGDKDQLPSVGPGAVLHDLLICGRIPVVQLIHIYRQADGSRIITSAHDVNEGRVPNLTNPPKNVKDEFYFYETDDPMACQDFVAKLCSKSIPAFFHLDPMEDIQVLTPMRKGDCGTVALNQRLQQELNPPSPSKPELTLNGPEQPRIFRLGDRVMQTKNNYDKMVFNGDLGRIIAVDTEAKSFRVAFDKETVDYHANECQQLLHAYAVTIHKSQGCEFPAVVTPLLGAHFVMLQRNLLYTAITRAKKLFILAGATRAVQRAVENDTPLSRMTRLAWRIQNPTTRPLEQRPATPTQDNLPIPGME